MFSDKGTAYLFTNINKLSQKLQFVLFDWIQANFLAWQEFNTGLL